MGQSWPVAEIDSVRQLRVLAAAVPGIAIVERIIPLPFETVWSVASDLENDSSSGWAYPRISDCLRRG